MGWMWPRREYPVRNKYESCMNKGFAHKTQLRILPHLVKGFYDSFMDRKRNCR